MSTESQNSSSTFLQTWFLSAMAANFSSPTLASDDQATCTAATACTVEIDSPRVMTEEAHEDNLKNLQTQANR